MTNGLIVDSIYRTGPKHLFNIINNKFTSALQMALIKINRLHSLSAFIMKHVFFFFLPVKACTQHMKPDDITLALIGLKREKKSGLAVVFM